MDALLRSTPHPDETAATTPRRTPGRPARVVALGLVLAVAATACGDRGAEQASAEPGAGEAGGVATAGIAADDATTTTVAPLFSSDFEAVCAGAGQPRATAYRAEAPGPHPVLLLQGAGDQLIERAGDLPEAWRVDWEPGRDALTAIELVACAVATPGAVVRECTGYEDADGRTSTQTVQLRAASYEVTLREATTGDVVTSGTVAAGQGTCPLVVSDDTTEVLATDDLAVVRLLAPVVEG